jgi:predicted ArsR family transcriptional regulator
MPRNFKRLERIVRGFSNHRRIEILELLDSRPQLSLTDIAARLGINFKTAFEHVRRLASAELITKRAKGPAVLHAVSPLGKRVLMFLRTLERANSATTTDGNLKRA